MLLLVFCAAILCQHSIAKPTQSNPQHRLNPNHGLKAYKVGFVWDEADRICRSKGGYLASPISEDILKDMKYFFDANRQDNKYFIGTRAREVPGEYVSIEGIALEDMPVFDMLERLDPDEGDCLAIDYHRISVVPCRTPLPFICHLNETTSNNERDCATEGYRYVVSTDRCYKLYSEPALFTSAEATCVAEGAHLVVLHDYKEWQAAHDIMKNLSTIWLGVQDTGRGFRSIVDDVPLEQLYQKLEPRNNPQPYYKCLTLTGIVDIWTGQILHNHCGTNASFICEKHPE